jgi:hypothetical protein
MVPWVPQHTESTLCFPASIYMVIEFYLDHHDRKDLVNGMVRPSLAEAVEACHTSIENGTKVSADLIERLNQRFDKLTFELRVGVTLGNVKELLDHGVPPILLYDGQYLLTETLGAGHAGVCVGMARNGDPILNNPWLGQGFPATKDRFGAAWDIRGRKAIIVNIKPQRTLDQALEAGEHAG